jgi:orotate phosphoribosyltransferase
VVEIPTAVYVIWWATLIVAVVVVLPLAVYLLHRTLMAARQIERYAALALEGGVGIAGNTENIAALEETITTATGILETARAIEEHTGTIEGALATRAEGSA